jgi:hypothetical protein
MTWQKIPADSRVLPPACPGRTCRKGRELEGMRESASLYRSSVNGRHTRVPSVVHEVLHEPGMPLDTATRSTMEPLFGHDFSHVRVHTDAKAAESARAVHALAYTVGHDVVFGAGQFAPRTDPGERLLAHELAHVVQVSGVDGWIPSGTSIASTIIRRMPDSPAPDEQVPEAPGRLESYVFAGDKRLKTDKDFARQSGRQIGDRIKKNYGKVLYEDRLELQAMRDFFQAEAKEVFVKEIQDAVADAKKKLQTAGKSGTVFHPGVMHDHKPSGRWSEVQANPNSQSGLDSICRHSDPAGVVLAAGAYVSGVLDPWGSNKPLPAIHLGWFLKNGSGADFDENYNLELMLTTDAGVQKKISDKIPTGQSGGNFVGSVTITQDNYDDDEFKNSFGEIDRLDFEVDFTAGTLHAWFLDRYEWHPVYPFYQKYSDDIARPTNCVHAAAVELKSGKARDYWMKGEATIPLKALKSTASRWTEPAKVPM